jgi:hypothetical protein
MALSSLFRVAALVLACSSVLFSQVTYTANQKVRPYAAGFHPGVNNGYFPGWTNEQLGALAAKAGGRSMRFGMTEEIAELFGYDILVNLFEWYERQGMKEHTVILSGPIDWHRDEEQHCAQARSALFKNLYLPIWDGGANGTPYNDDNYFAAYTYKMATTYKGRVRFWEVWNEPGFDLTGSTGWLPQGYPKNWWENDPNPCDYILRAPIQHYIRTLRIAWEVVKTVDSDAYVTCSGVGYPAFLDALLRQTDNPQGGAVTPDFPLKGGAYFDAVGFHSYPHFDGSVRYWDNSCQCMVNKRHSDGAADGIIRNLGVYQDVLNKYGYNNGTFPAKIWNITEGNIPAKSFVWGSETLLGGPEIQRNFIIKAVARMMQAGVAQYDLFPIFNFKNPAEAQEPFEVMGLYEKPAASGSNAVPTLEGVAYQTAALHLFSTVYDAQRTAALQLPPNIGGGAFRAPDGSFVYVLWAKTLTDQSETATSTYVLPAFLQTKPLYARGWDFSKNPVQQSNSLTALTLTEIPVFLVENPNWGLPKTDTRPKADLELALTTTPANPQAGQEATLALTVFNKSNVRSTDVEIVDFLEFAKPFLTDRLRYVSHQAPAGSTYLPQKGRWAIPVVEAGQQMTLSVRVKAIHNGTFRVFAQVGRASTSDPDSEPLNGQSNKVPLEDDEAVFILNDNGWLDIKADLVVETTRFPEKAGAGTALPLTHMVRNNSRVPANASVGRYFLSSDTLLSQNDVSLGEYSVTALPPYAYETKQTTLALPNGLPDGQYYLLFVCDATGTTDEFDENNVFVRPLHIVNPVPVFADLVLRLLSAPDSLRVDQTTMVTAIIQNIGNTASAYYNVSFSLSTDSIADPRDLPLAGDLQVPLEGGIRDTVVTELSIPISYTRSGRHWLLATVLSTFGTAESDTTNNRLAHPFALRLYMPATACRTELGEGQLLCAQNTPQGNVEVYRQKGREWFRTTLDAKARVQKTEGPFPLVYDSVLIRNKNLLVKKADGSIVSQRPLPSALLQKLPVPEQAALRENGHFLIGGFRKYFHPQGIQPLNTDTLVLIETDANLNILKEIHLATNRALIAGDRLHALVPLASDRVVVIYTTITENVSPTPRLLFLLYDLTLQKTIREEIRYGYHPKTITKTPCGLWRFETDYLIAAQKGYQRGISVFYLHPDSVSTLHNWGTGAGSWDYFGPFKVYQFASGLPDSLTTGLFLRKYEPLPDLLLRYRRPDNSLFLDTVPFVQFQHLLPTNNGAMLFGIENEHVWAATHDCNRSSVSATDVQEPSALRIYPNPSTGQITVEHPLAEAATLSIWHSTGTLVHRQPVTGPRTVLELGYLPSGAYIIHIQSGHVSFLSKWSLMNN